MSDLTDEEQGNVRKALRHLRIRCGTWALLAKAMGFKASSVIRAHRGNDEVSARMAFKVARLAGVALEDVLAGKWPAQGTCPHCGARESGVG